MSLQKNILVTGANGQLGREFQELAGTFPQYNFLFVAKEDLSIADENALENYFASQAVHICINCAAYTAVDNAEQEQELAMSINAIAPGKLAAVCKKYGARIIHFSTDYVFNGNATAPYSESEPTDPVNFYGHTKLLGEKAVTENNPEAIIIRTSWVYSRFGKNFVKTMLRIMAQKESIAVVADQYGCPTYAADLANAVMAIIEKDKFIPGVFHYCNNGIINWYDFALAIAALGKSHCIVNAIPTTGFPTPAKRPQYSALDTKKIQHAFALNIPDWKTSLAKCIALLSDEKEND